MITILRFHRLGPDALKSALASLQSHFSFVLPGDPLTDKSLLLTFDDALFDFYEHVFPLLKEMNLRALLAVCPRYILESTTVSKKKRLAVPYTLSMQDEFFESQAPFCTWQELEEMVRSGHVEIACHSYSKKNLTLPFVNLEREVLDSKKMLEERLAQVISSFTYPFGKVNKRVAHFVSEHYPYCFVDSQRSQNRAWHSLQPLHRLLYDVRNEDK